MTAEVTRLVGKLPASKQMGIQEADKVRFIAAARQMAQHVNTKRREQSSKDRGLEQKAQGKEQALISFIWFCLIPNNPFKLSLLDTQAGEF